MKALFTKLACGVALLLLAPGLVFAQTGTISGTVFDGDTGDPLPGATVQIPDLGMGTATSAQGTYEISNVPAGEQVVRVSFVGYESQEQIIVVEADETVEADFQLTAGIGLDEVVVTALGIEKEQRSLGYATQTVDADQVAKAAETNIANALQGTVAGLQIQSSSGQPGSASKITIRGNTSYREGANDPLIVVDGMPISNAEDDNARLGLNSGGEVIFGGTQSRFLDIDPSIIESINVLKGASATALYGSRAANGAIVITTKGSGATGRDRVTASFRSRVAFDDAIIEGFQDEYLGGSRGAFINGLPPGEGGYNELADPNSPSFDSDASPNSTFSGSGWGPRVGNVSEAVLDSVGRPSVFNPREQFYETGTTVENSIGLSASTDFGNLYANVSDTRQDGTVPGTELNRTSILANFSSELTDKLRFRASANYIDTFNDFLPAGNGRPSFIWHLQNVPISYDITPTTFEDGTDRSPNPGNNNPLWFTDNVSYTSDVKRLIGNTEISYDILPWLTVKERIGVDTYTDTRKEKVNLNVAYAPDGSLFDQSIKRTEINSDFTISGNRDLNDDFSLDFLVGNNISRRTFSTELVRGSNLDIPDFFNVSNARSVQGEQEQEEQVLIGVFSSATVDYRDYLYLTLTARNDWSSTLPLDNNSYFYPSASLGFVFTDAFSNVFEGSPLSFGKLRVAISQVGNDASPYNLITPFITTPLSDCCRGEIAFPFQGFNAFSQSDIQRDPSLKPEITSEYELGADLRFFNGRARLDATYYDRTTQDQIFQVPRSSATGFDDKFTNAGEIRNRGIEVELSGTPLQIGDFSWDLGVNFADNTTEVVELSEGVENIFLTGFTTIQIRAQEGEGGYGVIFGQGYFRNGDISEQNSIQIAGEVLTSPIDGFSDDAILTRNGLPLRAPNLKTVGETQVDWTGSVRSTFSWKGLSLSQLWETSQGGQILNFDQFYTTTNGQSEWTEDRGSEVTFDGIDVSTGEENSTSVTKDQSFYTGAQALIFERFVEDASYVKLRELSLSYSIPRSLLSRAGLKGATITATGRNLLIFSDFSYGDPTGGLNGSDNGQGFYHGVAPSNRTYSVSLSFDI